jgi:hypothetical protein
MSFMPAVRREIRSRLPGDPVRLTLEFLLRSGASLAAPITKRRIVDHLRANGIRTSGTHFQQTVLADSRASDYFIGSNHRGYFLIRGIGEARSTQAFYNRRIAAERTNLRNLQRQALRVGWRL